ncbi:MAG: ATP-binding protein [Nitrospiraceae bacterium]|nr:ATP-binding protein [Nitrospiraceae bacterium]
MIQTITDITEKHLLEEERLKTQKLESIGTLAGGIAHDFNNLLQGIFGYLSMAKLTYDHREKSLEMLEQAEKAIHVAVGLTTQLLTFSKGGKPAKKLMDLMPAVENAIKFALSGSQTDYRIEAAEDLCMVEADEGQLMQVIQNIALNADEAMSGRGTVTVAIENADIPRDSIVGLSGGGRFVRVSIRDTGAGIPEEDLPRIFDPYFTTKQKGSGLGLAAAYSIIRNHGGVIQVESEVSKGSLFIVYLPAAKKAEEGTLPASVPAAPTKKGRVLFMDDEVLMRDVAGEMIAVLGHEIQSAADGSAAIEMFRRARDEGRPFDVVILDLTVKGGMGGEEALRHLREIDPFVKAVVSSGYAGNAIVADYRAHGFAAFLNKPYRLEALRECLNALLAEP